MLLRRLDSLTLEFEIISERLLNFYVCEMEIKIRGEKRNAHF